MVTMLENLTPFAGIAGLTGKVRTERIDEVIGRVWVLLAFLLVFAVMVAFAFRTEDAKIGWA